MSILIILQNINLIKKILLHRASMKCYYDNLKKINLM